MEYINETQIYTNPYEGWVRVGSVIIKLSSIEAIQGVIEDKQGGGIQGCLSIYTANRGFSFGFVIPAEMNIFKESLMEAISKNKVN